MRGENGEVQALAARWGQLLISGGDRHGMEANANINLTNATSFNEFVREVRVERRSHVHFLEQYKGSWQQRIMDSTVDAVVNHAEFSPGWQRWDERAFHPDANGVMQPLSELWVNGRVPLLLHAAVAVVRLNAVPERCGGNPDGAARGCNRKCRRLLARLPGWRRRYGRLTVVRSATPAHATGADLWRATAVCGAATGARC